MGMVCGVCADGAASSAPGHGLAIVGSEGASGTAAAGIESAAPRADLRMLTRAELPAHLANLIESFGAVEVFTQLLRVCPRELLQEACRRVWEIYSEIDRFRQFGPDLGLLPVPVPMCLAMDFLGSFDADGLGEELVLSDFARFDLRAQAPTVSLFQLTVY